MMCEGDDSVDDASSVVASGISDIEPDSYLSDTASQHGLYLWT